ncbi:MAG: aryldialkylphosphatase [Micrococcales bacterium 73-13]|nr:MAG: aryldialkylphosphatase [Micrococcales bacterium 73-13]
MTGAVRTVLGDVVAEQLGATDYHEHMFQASPLLRGEELDDEEASGREAESLRDSGFAAFVDATPIGLGRDPLGLERIARATGLRIVASTGLHKREHYPPGHWVLEADEDALTELFVQDLLDGMPVADVPSDDRDRRATQVRAGLVKLGIGYWRIGLFERRAAAAAGGAHRRTGAPVMVHLEHGSAALEILAALSAEGVTADAVVLAHVDRNPDPVLHAELAAAGAYLGYDGWARHRDWPDSTLAACIAEVCAAGGRDRVLLGGDVARRSRYRAYGGIPGLEYLGRRVLPRLERELGADVVARFTTSNPARLLGRF